MSRAALALVLLSLWGCAGPRGVSQRVVFGPAQGMERFDDRLVGTWGDGERAYTFLPPDPADGPEVGYKVLYSEGEGASLRGPVNLAAWVTTLGDLTLLDLAPAEAWTHNEFLVYHLLALHSVYRVEVLGDTLRLAVLDQRKVQDLLAGGGLTWEPTQDGPLITSPGDVLRQFIEAHPEALFAEPVELMRR